MNLVRTETPLKGLFDVPTFFTKITPITQIMLKILYSCLTDDLIDFHPDEGRAIILCFTIRLIP
jgi:hypothetical protein